MDEFKDLDIELARLREEMSAKDELARQFRAPTESDYWKHRVDEERVLWKKKMEASALERKAMEDRLAMQQEQLDNYNQSVRELERRLEQDTRAWEDRLRAKEADLLIEKNRLMSEAKVREAEYEKQSLFKQLTEINAKLLKMREEHDDDRKNLLLQFAAERGALEEKMKAEITQEEILRSRIAELETAVAAKGAELDKTKSDLSSRASNLEQQLVVSQADKARIAEDAAKAKQRSEEDKQRTRQSMIDLSVNLVQGIRRFAGPLRGIRQLEEGHALTKESRSVYSELLQHIENESDTFLRQANAKPPATEALKAALFLDETDAALWEKTAGRPGAEFVRMERKNIKRRMNEAKPLVAIVSTKWISVAYQVRKYFPFVPVIVYGEPLKERKTKKLLAAGIHYVPAPANSADMCTALETTAFTSVARPEFWGRIKVKASPALPIAAAVLMVCAAAAGVVVRKTGIPHMLLPAPVKPLSYQLPYTQPANITFDGQYLWGCDWYGQSIYKHSVNGDMKLVRIFSFPGRHFGGLAWAGGYLWSADVWEKKIYKHNPDENLTVIATYPAPGDAPSGLAGDGNVLWSCDVESKAIYKHALDDKLTVQEIYDSPGDRPSGLYYDGKTLWSVDSQTNRVYKHLMNADLSVASTYLLPDFEQKGYNLSGIARSKDTFWICSEKAGRVYQYKTSMLKESKTDAQ